jgi:hypothetical protein
MERSRATGCKIAERSEVARGTAAVPIRFVREREVSRNSTTTPAAAERHPALRAT